jgi:hypothetical protein
MRGSLLLVLVVLGSAACAAGGVRWERAGGTEAERRRDETECAAQANRDRAVPTRRITRSDTRTNESIELVTVRNLDSGAFYECMRSRGYERVPSRPPS